MSLFSELRSWAKLEWRSTRGLLAFVCAGSVISGIATLDARIAIAFLALFIAIWALWLVVRVVGLALIAVPVLAIGKALRPRLQAAQLKRDVEREMRKPPFEQT